MILMLPASAVNGRSAAMTAVIFTWLLVTMVFMVCSLRLSVAEGMGGAYGPRARPSFAAATQLLPVPRQWARV